MDDAGDKVWISTVTLADIRKACKTGKNLSRNRRELVRIPSKQNRESILTEAGRAIANKEQESMALYGGRPWTVTARVTEPKGQKPPLFRWFRGELELAVLPHLLEKIPDPPKLKGNQEYTEGEEYVPSTSLEERTVSSLSWVAWESPEYAIPNVTVKWLSPDHTYFYSRKSAWEHQNKLAEQQLFLQKMLHGLGHRGQKLKPFKPTQKDAMKTGKWRFLRDGLWVVGQEEAWQQERAEWWEEELERKAAAALEAERKKAAKKNDENDKKPAAGKRSLTALALYLQSERRKYRDEKVEDRKLAQGDSTEPFVMTLRQAETELREVWKTLSTEEQNVWKERANQLALKETTTASTDVVPDAAPKEASVTEEVASAQNHGVLIQQDVAVSADDPATAVSPSPPSVPMTDAETQSEEQNKEFIVTSVQQATHVEAESETVVVVESKPAVQSDAHTSVAASEAALVKHGSELDQPSNALGDTANAASLVVPDTVVESVPTAKVPQTATTVAVSIEADSCDSSNSTAATKPQVVSVAKKSSVGVSSAKKRRKSVSSVPKKITPSSQFNMTPEQIELCHSAVTNHFEMVMNTVKARALHNELQDGFDLLRERGRGRYDMELPVFDNPEFSFLTDLQRAAWMPIVREILGEDVILIHKGAFLSMPGAEGQVYHQDGPHLSTQTQRPCHAVNVFIPLVDLSLRNGPTEFCLGTHVLGHENFVKDRVYTPCNPAGVPVMFDYRLGHRGLANNSAEPRPIVYCTYAAAAKGKEFRDSVNFSRRRYHKIGNLVEKPLSRAERAAKRRKSQSDAMDSPLETAEASPDTSETAVASAEVSVRESAPVAAPPASASSESTVLNRPKDAPGQEPKVHEATDSSETQVSIPEQPTPAVQAAPPVCHLATGLPYGAPRYEYGHTDGNTHAQDPYLAARLQHVLPAHYRQAYDDPSFSAFGHFPHSRYYADATHRLPPTLGYYGSSTVPTSSSPFRLEEEAVDGTGGNTTSEQK